MAKLKTKLKAKAGPAKALHLADQQDAHHLVKFRNLRVVIVPDGPAWFAQGIDLDYAAQGDTVEEAKGNFEKGLGATIDQHLKAYRTISGILKVAEPELLAHLLVDSSAQFNRYSQVSAHIVHEALHNYQINYLLDKESSGNLVQ
jgi:hypothetical protein